MRAQPPHDAEVERVAVGGRVGVEGHTGDEVPGAHRFSMSTGSMPSSGGSANPNTRE